MKRTKIDEKGWFGKDVQDENANCKRCSNNKSS